MNSIDFMKCLFNFVDFKPFQNGLSSMLKNLAGVENIDDAMRIVLNDGRKKNKVKRYIMDSFARNYAHDKASARRRDERFVLAKGTNFRANFLLTFVCIGLVLCCSFIFFYKNIISPDLLSLASAIAGILATCLKEVFYFEFGSTKTLNDFHRKNDAFLDEDIENFLKVADNIIE